MGEAAHGVVLHVVVAEAPGRAQLGDVAVAVGAAGRKRNQVRMAAMQGQGVAKGTPQAADGCLGPTQKFLFFLSSSLQKPFACRN
jgi:hypothetical protein